MSKKTKIVIQFLSAENARVCFHVLTSLKEWRCGLRSIACTIRRLIQEAKISHE